jgi:YD repeat-containing protein
MAIKHDRWQVLVRDIDASRQVTRWSYEQAERASAQV